MDKAALKEFRAKLVKAQQLEKHLSGPRGSRVELTCKECGIDVSDDIIYWVTSQPICRRLQVKALFENSIAAIDKQIAELHQ